MARYLIEPLNQQEVVYNENLKQTQAEIVATLKELVGYYNLYSSEEDNANDQYVSEDVMQKKIVERFGRAKQSFIECL